MQETTEIGIWLFSFGGRSQPHRLEIRRGRQGGLRLIGILRHNISFCALHNFYVLFSVAQTF